MEKTIKELADELGISKDKVKYRVAKLSDEYLLKKKGITYITDEGVEELYKQFSDNLFDDNEHDTNESNKSFEFLEKELNLLRLNSEEKDKQLKQSFEQRIEIIRELENEKNELFCKILEQNEEILRLSEENSKLKAENKDLKNITHMDLHREKEQERGKLFSFSEKKFVLTDRGKIIEKSEEELIEKILREKTFIEKINLLFVK